jgi:two-component system response regulator BaeR
MSRETSATGRPLALIVEDEPRTASWLRLYLEHAGCDVRVARDGAESLALSRDIAPDVVLLDLMLPGVNGWDVCAALRSASRTPIIVITARASEEDRLRGFACGADDYVVKPFSPREVVARVRALLRRAQEPDPAQRVSQSGMSLDLAAYELRVGDAAPIKLTPVETRLLATLLRSPHRVFTRSQLVDRLFGDDYGGGERTVDAHVKNLRRKLTVSDPIGPVIETVYGSGYRLVRRDDPA